LARLVIADTDAVVDFFSDTEPFAQSLTELKSKRVTIGNQDILIAGVCLANELPLATRNTGHFGVVRGLEIYRS
jgi:predicted nucleic acid-binding protein